MLTIAVIDYGMGNLRSVSKALEHVTDQRVLVTSKAQEIQQADKIVFPGVGAIRDCMNELNRLGLKETLIDCVKTRPFLGICLGMQSMLGSSEENEGTECFNVVSGSGKYFGTLEEKGERLKVPHMGWNQVEHTQDHPLWHNIEQNSRFYFVHSYYADPLQVSDIASTTQYGLKFASAIAKGSLFATQFHPEKSQHDGLQLLKNFVLWDGAQ